MIDNPIEKAFALNMLMRKYQIEGIYESLNQSMRSVRAVSVIKVVPRKYEENIRSVSTGH